MTDVRPVDPGDRAEWLRMRTDLWPGDEEAHAADIAMYFAGEIVSPLQVLIAVDDTGARLGFAELAIRGHVDGCDTDRVAFLEGWYVKAEYRKGGVGRALIVGAEAWARAQGCTEFGSNALVANHPSAMAHGALGFQPTEQVQYFRKMLEPAGQPRVEETSIATFLKLVDARRGHFLLESGYHGGLWLDLEPLFADAARIDPFVAMLATALRPYRVDAVCGPDLGGAFLAQLVARVLGVEFCFTERSMPPNATGLYRASYRLPQAFANRLAGRRVAIVDDVISAGSAVRGTYATLEAHRVAPVVVGALLVLGPAGESFFTERGIPVESAARDAYELWKPSACPLCASGVPLECAPGLS